MSNKALSFLQTVQHGFPHKPSAMAYDPKLKLMAIGTHTGIVKVFGQPGVEFYGQHTALQGANAQDMIVQQIEWIPDSGRLISLTTANVLVLWEPAGHLLVPIKTITFEGKLKKVSSLYCSLSKDVLWIGTEGGDIHQLEIKTFKVKESIINHDIVLDQ